MTQKLLKRLVQLPLTCLGCSLWKVGAKVDQRERTEETGISYKAVLIFIGKMHWVLSLKLCCDGFLGTLFFGSWEMSALSEETNTEVCVLGRASVEINADSTENTGFPQEWPAAPALQTQPALHKPPQLPDEALWVCTKEKKSIADSTGGGRAVLQQVTLQPPPSQPLNPLKALSDLNLQQKWDESKMIFLLTLENTATYRGN